jgi:peptide/nickel transport system permease protein
MRNKFMMFLHYLMKDKPLLVGTIIVTFMVILTIIGPVVAPYDPMTTLPGKDRLPPNLEHFFGTDPMGLDVFSRVISSPRVDLTIAITSSLLSFLIGVPLGIIAGYFKGRGSQLLQRSADLIQSFPLFVLAMILVMLLGQKISSVIYVLTFLFIPIYFRLARSEAINVREKPYILAAICVGESNWNIIWREMFINCYQAALAQVSVLMGWAILLTAGLTWVGAGIRPPTPEWGSMIAIGGPVMITGQWWGAVFPGIMIGITVLGFALVGEGIDRYISTIRMR